LGQSEVSIGGPSAAHGRNRKREAIGGLYSLVLRLMLGVRVQGTHRRISALRADVARRILPTVGNRDWLFDTELLAVLSGRASGSTKCGSGESLPLSDPNQMTQLPFTSA
jgi:hypothetical protein